jgi:hypothetical protein
MMRLNSCIHDRREGRRQFQVERCCRNMRNTAEWRQETGKQEAFLSPSYISGCRTGRDPLTIFPGSELMYL